MRIAYVVNQFPPYITSGLGRYVEEITPYLAADHELTVYTLNDGSQPSLSTVDGIEAYRPGGRFLRVAGGGRRLNRTRRAEFLRLAAYVLWNNLRYVRRLRRSTRPDLVVVHDSTNFLSGLLSHYLLRLPVVLHLHTTEYGVAPQRTIADRLRVFARLERWLSRIARRVVVASDEVREQLVRTGWNPDTIDVVPLGGTFERVLTDPALDRAELRADASALRVRLGIGPDDPVLLFVGRLEKQKGVYPLLAAMPAISSAVPGVRLVLVGEGDDAGVARIAAEAGLSGQVVTSGRFVSGRELLAYYELADVCAFPSLFEPFGLVATEAMAMGRATVLGDGFPRLFLGDPAQPAVRYVDTDDPADIAAGVIAVLTDPDLRRNLAERGERFVREELSWSATAAATHAVYQAAIDAKPALADNDSRSDIHSSAPRDRGPA